MRFNHKKKGFTIVELIIVIAVIGVLSAILIPTFISLTQKANRASDNSLVANLNTALAMQEGEVGDQKNQTMHDAVVDLKYQGFDLDTIVSKSDEDIVWNQNDNRFYLSSKTPAGVKAHELWHIQDNVSSQRYSIYASSHFATSDVTVTAVGFDAGYHTDIASVAYNGSEGGIDVRVRTGSGTLTVDAEKDSVYHYGVASIVNILKVDTASYHENGEVTGYISIAEGHIEFDVPGDYILKVESSEVTANNDSGATVTVYSDEPLDEDSFDNIDVTSVESADALNEIKTFQELQAAVQQVNAGTLDNPVLVLSALSYDFTERLTVSKSATFKGIPEITTLNGYANTNGSSDAGAFFVNPSTAAQEVTFEGLFFNCFGVYANAAKTTLCGSGVYSNTAVVCQGLADTVCNVKDCRVLGLGGTALKLNGGTMNVSNSIFDATVQNSVSGNLIQSGNDSSSAVLSTMNIEGCTLMNSVSVADAEYSASGIYSYGKSALFVKDTVLKNCEDSVYSYQWGYYGPRPTIEVQHVTLIDCEWGMYDYRFFKQTSELPGQLSEYTLEDGDYYKNITNQYGDVVCLYFRHVS